MPLADGKPRVSSQIRAARKSAFCLPAPCFSQSGHLLCMECVRAVLSLVCQSEALLKDAGGVAMETEQQRSREQGLGRMWNGVPVLSSTAAPPDDMEESCVGRGLSSSFQVSRFLL